MTVSFFLNNKLQKYKHMKNQIRILIADDHDLIIDGIKAMLQSIPEFEIIGEARNGLEAVNKSLTLKPDVIIMDISMPVLSGIEACEQIIKKNPSVKIIMLTQYEDYEYIIQALNIGAYGYLLKTSRKNEFVEAINSVALGKKYMCQKVSDYLISGILVQHKKKEKPETEINNVTLTRREKEIISLIADSNTNKQISEKLFISLRTVETHRKNLMQKLKVKNVVALIRYALQKKIINFK
ncbi:MAG: DNA-binding response regulator [Bacteroidetes bacterium CG23_combo_of_CG06-09_8_20_14_all_32_9]|nr:MAG: DNA-binding response regulator [Bacteroidetes bacterium CG23_combo_of_CG06-09_8_20_14_all_32_9]